MATALNHLRPFRPALPAAAAQQAFAAFVHHLVQTGAPGQRVGDLTPLDTAAQVRQLKGSLQRPGATGYAPA